MERIFCIKLHRLFLLYYRYTSLTHHIYSEVSSYMWIFMQIIINIVNYIYMIIWSTRDMLKITLPAKIVQFFIWGLKRDSFLKYYMLDANMNIIFDCIFNIWYVVFEPERPERPPRTSQFVHLVFLPAINYYYKSKAVLVLEWFAFIFF